MTTSMTQREQAHLCRSRRTYHRRSFIVSRRFASASFLLCTTVATLFLLLQPYTSSSNTHRCVVVSAFSLSTLFNRRVVDTSSDDDVSKTTTTPEDEDDDTDPPPPPPRDIVEELGGQDEYRRKIAKALNVETKDLSTTAASTDDGDAGTTTTDIAIAKVEEEVEYGVDVTFPIHRNALNTHPFLGDKFLGNRFYTYSQFMVGCKNRYGAKQCEDMERNRMRLNLEQPKLMQNYTDIGFQKLRVPSHIYNLLQTYWSQNNRTAALTTERWSLSSASTIHTNHWSVPTSTLPLQSETLIDSGGGPQLRNAIWDGIRNSVTQWIGGGNVKLNPASLYGIRVYHEGAIVPPTVNVLPMVCTALIQLDQELDNEDEIWPFEVYGHDGKAYNVTLEPGDMILYEGHSIIHGRPFALKGKYSAVVMVHFEPLGHSIRHEEKMSKAKKKKNKTKREDDDLEEFYKVAMEQDHTHDAEQWEDEGLSKKQKKGKVKDQDDLEELYRKAMEHDHTRDAEQRENRLPGFILEGTKEEKRWTQDHGIRRWKVIDKSTTYTSSTQPKGSNDAHMAAKTGDLSLLIELIEINRSLLQSQDVNGWQPIHEAARGGHKDILEFLIKEGADMNSRTNNGKGGTPLWWARKNFKDNHPAVKYLMKVGALEIEPDP